MKPLVCLLALGLTFDILANCELPPGEKIKIACTHKCGRKVETRLKLASFRLGYSVEFVKLRELGAVKESLQKVDAVVLPGGADIDPEYYLDNVTEELAQYTRENLNLVVLTEEGKRRDPYEHEVVTTYSKDGEFKKLPMLGICRGMQMMSVAQGIPLYLDINTELGIPNRVRKFDAVKVSEPASLMSSLYGRKKFKGWEMHHQGIRVDYYKAHQQDYPLTRVTAFSNKGQVAEALEYTHRPALGVQFHPESSFPKATFPVFKWFLTKACEYKNSLKDLP